VLQAAVVAEGVLHRFGQGGGYQMAVPINDIGLFVLVAFGMMRWFFCLLRLPERKFDEVPLLCFMRLASFALCSDL